MLVRDSHISFTLITPGCPDSMAFRKEAKRLARAGSKTRRQPVVERIIGLEQSFIELLLITHRDHIWRGRIMTLVKAATIVPATIVCSAVAYVLFDLVAHRKVLGGKTQEEIGTLTGKWREATQLRLLNLVGEATLFLFLSYPLTRCATLFCLERRKSNYLLWWLSNELLGPGAGRSTR